jgi:CSLREA domain-containing protein
VFAKPLEDLAKPMVPAALPAPAPLPAAPVVGSVTSTMTAALTATANNGDGKADPGDTITYTLSLANASGAGATGLAIANPLDSHTTLVTIPPSLNSTPVAFDQSVSLNEDATLIITLSGQDPDGTVTPNFTFKQANAAHTVFTNFPSNPTTIATAHGTIGNFGALTCDANGVCSQQVTYTPAANYNGPDSFTFVANDVTANSNENGVVTINVIAVNDAPTFTPASNPAAVNEDAGLTTVTDFISEVRPAQGLPTPNTTEDTQTVSFVITNITHSALFTAGGQPVLTVQGSGVAPFPRKANLTYTPAPNANGTSVVTYHLHDNGGTSPGVDNSADQTFTITVNAVNDAPVVDPVAKAFTVQANMKSSGLTGLLANATDPDATNANADSLSADKIAGYTSPTFTLASVTGACTALAQPCTISITNASNGTFNFDPPPGVASPIVLNYTISDNGNPGSATSAAGTINVTVNGPVIWFVDPARANNGNGTLSDTSNAVGPFNSLASATSAMGVNTAQRIFVYSGTTALNAAVPLAGASTRANAQWLIGQGVAGSTFDSFFGISPPASTFARPSIGGTRPTIRGLVTVRDNTTVQGLNIDVSGAAALTKGILGGSLTNAATSTILIKDVNVTSADGIAADLGAGGTLTWETSNASTSPNTITSSTGTGLNVANTTIGANGMTFRSITAGTGSASGGAGIILDNTGNSGSLTVSGNGSAGTGGTIQNKNGGDVNTVNADGTLNLTGTTGVGIFLRSTKSPSFSWMALHDFTNFAIVGSSVTGLTLNQVITSGVNGSNPNVHEGAMNFDNLTTSASITNTTIAGGVSNNFSLINTAGSLNRIVFDTCTFGAMDSGNVNGNDSLFVQGRNTATVNVTVQNTTMTSARGDIFQVDLTDTATADVLFKHNTVNNQHPFVVVGGGGLVFSGGGTTGAAPTLTYDIGGANLATDANTFRGARGDALLVVFQTGHGTATGKIRNNTFGVQAVDKSGASEASDIDIRTVGRAAQTVLISGNTLYQYANAGIMVQAGDNSVVGTSGTIGDINATITNNTVSNPNSNASTKAGIHVNLGTTAAPADTTILCADIGTNNAPNSGSTDASAGSDYVVRERQSTTMRLPGYNGTSADIAAVATYIKNRNTNGGSSSVFVATPGGGAPGYTNTSPAGSQCVQPVLPSGAMFKPEGSQQQFFAGLYGAGEKASGSPIDAPVSSLAFLSTATSLSEVLNHIPAATAPVAAVAQVEESRAVSAGTSQVVMPTVTAEARVGAVYSSGSHGAGAKNSLSSFANAIAAMIEPTAHAEAKMGAQRSFVRLNHAVKAEIRGETAGIRSQEAGVGNQRSEVQGQRSDVRLNHARANSKLKAENSRLVGTAAAPFTPVGQFPINGTGAGQGFQLPDGKSITITFKATLNAPPNFASYSATQKVSAQAALTGNIPGVPVPPLLSDDTTVVGSADPTSTNVDLYDSTTTVVSSANPANTSQSVTFTATIGTAGTPNGSATNRTGTVVFKDSFNGGPVTALTCSGGNQNVTSNQATCITSSLATGSHVITADYPGDGNFDPSSAALTANGPQNGNPQIINKSGTNATLTSSLNPSTVTQTVTFTATITTATSVPNPTGSVTFKDSFNGGPVNALTCTGGTQTLNGSGVATCQISSLAVGNHVITADYGGDTNFNANNGIALSGGSPSGTQVVSKATPTVTLVSDTNPSFVSQTVTFTATVSAPAGIGGTPSGTLTFKDGGAAMICTGGNQVLNGSGVATCQRNNLTAGNHTITVDYPNTDPNFNAVSGTAMTGNPQVVNQSNTTMTVTSSNPSAKVTESVTFTLNIKTNGGVAGPPGGTLNVKFWDGPANTGTLIGGPKTLGTSGCIDATYSCVDSDVTTSLTAAGSPHTITVEYLGDPNFSANSKTLSQTIVKSDTQTTLGASPPSLPAVGTVTFTATVATQYAPVPGPPTGKVQFFDGASAITCTGAGESNTSTGETLSGGGTATCTTSTLTNGTHTIKANYNGDPTFNTSTTDPAGNLSYQVGPACVAAPVVTKTADTNDGVCDGDCSLREAIQKACDGGTITFSNTTAGGAVDFTASPHTINLADTANNELLVDKSLTITGPGSSLLTVQRISGATNKFRVFEIQFNKVVTITGMTISNGAQGAAAQPSGAPGAGGTPVSGGGIFNAGTLTLTSVVVSGNHIVGGDGGDGSSPGDLGGAGGAAYGGGIFNSGTLTLNNSTVNGGNSATGGKGGNTSTTPAAAAAGGDAFGGGVYSTFVLTLDNSTVDGNLATGGTGGTNSGGGPNGSNGSGLGGGVYNDASASDAGATINNSTISTNAATNGGGVYNFGSTGIGTLAITGSTINGNMASGNGGGVYNTGTGTKAPMSLTNSTVSGNLASVSGGGVFNDSNTSLVTLNSLTITGNYADNDGDTSGDGGGLRTITNNLTLNNTIVAGNFKGAAKQVETLPVAVTGGGTLSVGGNASLTISGNSFNSGTPIPYSVPVTALQDAHAVALDIKTELENGSHPEVTNFFDIVVIGANVRFTVKTAAPDDLNLNISLDGCTCQTAGSQSGLVPANSANTKAGSPSAKQQETVTVSITGGGPLTGDGVASVTISGANFNAGTPKTYPVSVTTGQNANAIANAIKTELENVSNTEITGYFDPIVVTGADLLFTVTTAAPDDPALNISIDSCTCTPGLDAANSVNTTLGAVKQIETLTVTVTGGGTLATGGNASITISAPGGTFNAGVPKTYIVPVTAGQDANAVANAIKTELENVSNTEITGYFDPILVTGPNAKFTVTTAATNDPNLNISIDSCTCTTSTSQAGLVVVPNSTNSTPGGTASPDDIKDTVASASSYNLIGDAATSGGLVDRLTDSTHQNQVGNGGSGTVDITMVLITTLAANGGPTRTHALKANSPAIDQGKDFTGPPPTDQRGFNRPVDDATVADATNGDGSDIGAFEQAPTPVPTISLSSVNGGGPSFTTRDTTPDFSVGNLVVGATVELLRDGNPTSPATTFTVTTTPMTLTDNTLTTDGPHTYTAKQTIGADAQTSSGQVVTVNTQPSTPVLFAADDTGAAGDNITKIATPRFTGGAPTDPNTTIQLLANGTLVGSTTSDPSGNWTITSSALAEGTYSITAKEVLGSFTTVQSAALSPVVIDLHIDPPSPPALLSTDDTGALGDNITGKTPAPATYTFTGTAEPGSSVQLFANGNPAGSGTADGLGGWSITTPPLADATYSMTAKASDAAGNLSTSSGSTSVTIDTTVPAAPSQPDLITGDDSGTFTNDNYTKVNMPTFSGTAESGTTVKVFANSVEVGSGPVTLGTWNIMACVQPACTALADGTYSITATATDTAGNTSLVSTGLSVTIDTQAPAKPTLPPDLVAADDTGASSTDNITKTNKPTFNGANTTVEASSIVDLYANGGPASVGTGSADGSGAWSVLACTSPGCNPFADGTYLFTVKATDLAGNQSVASDALQVVIDTVKPNVPSTPVLNPTDDTGISSSDKITKVNTPNFTGEAEADSIVQLFAGATPVGSGLANGAPGSPGNKAWTIISGLLSDNSYSMTARATDVAGNTSDPSGAFAPLVIDTVKPTVAMSSAVGNPTATTPIPVAVDFSEPVFGFTLGGIVPGPAPPPPPGATVGSFAGSGMSYSFNLTPGTAGGVFADIPAGGATDTAGNGNTAAAQFNRTFDPSALNATITAISPNPRNTAVSSIQIVFNKPVTGFDLADLTLKLNNGGNLLTGAQTLSSGDNATWTLGNLAGLTAAQGTYDLKLTAAGSNIQDSSSTALASDATASWVMDTTAPTVTVEQAVGQTDPFTGPTGTTTINFTATFSEPVTGLTAAGVTIFGTANPTIVNVSGSGTTYNLGVQGMSGSGTVRASVNASAATDSAGNGNTASTSADNTVQFNADNFSTLEVNSTFDTDDGSCDPLGTGSGNQDCTLREAINAANADFGADTITFNSTVFAAPGPYTINLLSALPAITSDMTITGPGAKVLSVKGKAPFRVFSISNNATVSISDLTVTNGSTTVDGGGISVDPGTLTITRVAVTGNTSTASGGGGIYSTGTLNVIESTISGNHVLPGGGGNGGGILNNLGTLSVVNSTISGNGGGLLGGGIYSTSSATVSNSTIAANSAQQGGGIYLSPSGAVTLKSTLIGDNTATISGPDVLGGGANGTLNSEGFNLIENTSGATITETLNPGTNITGQDPQLNPLADNGGSTKTHSLLCTSPAIDKGFKFTTTTDQRGSTRPFDFADAVYANAAAPGDGSDIGAFETQSAGGCVPLAIAPSPAPSTNEDNAVVITLKGTYSQNINLSFAITQNPAIGQLGAISAPNCVYDNPNLLMTCTATVTYTPNANANGADLFKFKVSAGGLDSDPADVNVTVNSLNDPPTFLQAGNQTVLEDAGPQDVANFITVFSPGPPDESGQTVQFIVTNNTNPGLFSAAPAIDGAGTLTYTPAANANGSATITIVAKDNGGGTDTSAPQSFTITVLSVNDAPSFTVGSDQTVLEDAGQQIVNTFATGISVGPAQESAQTAQFIITNNTNPGMFAEGPVISPTGKLTYISGPDKNGTATITVVLKDNGGTANGGQDTSPPQTFTINVTPVNDQPTLNAVSNVTIDEDAAQQNVNLSGISAGGGETQTLVLAATSNNPALIPNPTVVFTSPNATGSISFKPLADANGFATITLTLKDDGGNANGGVDTVVRTFVVQVNPVNDAPVNIVPGPQTVGENSTVVFAFSNSNSILVTDVDAAGSQVKVTLTATNGVITLANTAELAFLVGDGTADPTMTFVGSLTNINAAIQGLTFTPPNGFSGAASLQIITNDQGNTGSGGALTDTDTVSITVSDGGALQFSASTYSVSENNGPAVITITRAGGSAGTATVQIATSNGTATAGSDYTAVSQTVTFGIGETSKTVSVPITDELINEPDETVNLTLSNAGGSGALGAPATAVLTISNDDPTGGYIKFSAPSYSVTEGGVATITVQRVGTLTQAVSVDFATNDNSDPPALVLCAPTPGNTLASSRCDFTSAFGRLTWAAGDGADKTFKVMTTQDNYVEGPETLNLTLSNLSPAAAFSGPSTETLTITDDAVEPATNPIDDADADIEQLYRDFLNRPSDPSGKAFWVNVINHCNDPAQRPPGQTAAQCIQIARIVVGGAFFLSNEFQATGGTAYLANKASFGSLPTFARFERDAQQIGQGYVFGAAGAETLLETNKVAYFNDYVTRSEFVSSYGGLSDQQYVNTLISNTGVTFTQPERDALVSGLTNQTETRATVLRKIAEKPAFRAVEFNSMFVLMEYFGFLRRNPDQAGFNFWLNKLNQANGDYFAAEMVKAFIESSEYRQRFGQ